MTETSNQCSLWSAGQDSVLRNLSGLWCWLCSREQLQSVGRWAGSELPGWPHLPWPFSQGSSVFLQGTSPAGLPRPPRWLSFKSARAEVARLPEAVLGTDPCPFAAFCLSKQVTRPSRVGGVRKYRLWLWMEEMQSIARFPLHCSPSYSMPFRIACFRMSS